MIDSGVEASSNKKKKKKKNIRLMEKGKQSSRRKSFHFQRLVAFSPSSFFDEVDEVPTSRSGEDG